jgi:hypothetical protein
LPSEDPRYNAHRIRDRLDRGFRIRYLHEIGISADDDKAYNLGAVVQQLVHWPRRTVSLAEATRELNR